MRDQGPTEGCKNSSIQHNVTRQFNLSQSVISRLWSRHRQPGNVTDLPCSGRPRSTTRDTLNCLATLSSYSHIAASLWPSISHSLLIPAWLLWKINSISVGLWISQKLKEKRCEHYLKCVLRVWQLTAVVPFVESLSNWWADPWPFPVEVEVTWLTNL